MNIKEIDGAILDPNFTVDLLQILLKYGLVKEIDLRNALIKREHIISRGKGESNVEFMERMSGKYFCSISNINMILYGKPGKMRQ